MRDLLKYLRKYRLECILAPLFKLLEAVFVKDDQNKKLLEQIFTCPCRINSNKKEE